ncbi:MAG: hypothetical protein ABW000_07185 [Actinoplanes sp.]
MTDKEKLAALVISSYADTDGTGIHCGVARLATDLDASYSTARRYLAWMRTVGLIELVREGNARRKRSDEYRLTLGPDILEHIDVLDPDRYKALVDGLRDANRVAQKGRRERNQRSPGVSADDGVDNADQRSPHMSAEEADESTDQRSPQVNAESGISAHLEADQRSPLNERPPPLCTSPASTTSPTTAEDDLRTAVTVPGATDPNPPASTAARPPTPPKRKCSHGFAFRQRPDGTAACALCRRGLDNETDAPLADVIPIRAAS